jgi:preprotein translocase subunit SecY
MALLLAVTFVGAVVIGLLAMISDHMEKWNDNIP